MNRILGFVWAVVLLLSACSAPPSKGVEVRDAWARPAAQSTNGAVYFVIRSAEQDEIVGVSSDVAEMAEIHESSMSGEVMEMHHLGSVSLDAGEEVRFEPGSLHIMLVGLKQDLQTGDELEVTLHFKNYQDIQVRVPVQDTQP